MINRFNYNYSIKDFFFSLTNVKSNNHNSDILSNYFKQGDISFTSQGRVSLRLLLSSLNLKKNAKIGVQAYNCSNVLDAIKIAGFQPVFIDVNDSFTICLKDLEKKIDDIDALIVNHTFGIPADIVEIKLIVQGKPVIEDCAHSLFSLYSNQPTGSFFDASIFSIGYGKYPSIGKGGFTVINNKNILVEYKNQHSQMPSQSRLNENINILRNLAMSFANQPPLYSLVFYPLGKLIDKRINLTNKFGHVESKGYASNALLFQHNFEKYRQLNEIQRSKGKILVTNLSNNIQRIDDTFTKKLNFYIFPLISPNRDKIVDVLRKNKIESGKHFSNAINIAKMHGYKGSSCPNSERIVKEVFTIPSNYNLTNNELEKIVKIVNDLYR